MPRSPTNLAAIALLALGLVALPARAHAQSATEDAVYQDVKKIIEDLLTKEVSQTVATHLACLAGRREAKADTPNAIDISTDLSNGASPGADDKYVSLDAVSFFPNTLQAIYDQSYGNIKPVVLNEVSGFVGDMAYQLLRPQPAQAAGAASVQKTPTATKLGVDQVELLHLFDAREKLLDRRKVEAPKSPQPSTSESAQYAPFMDDTLVICGNNLGYKLATKQVSTGGSPLDRDCSLSEPTRDEYACDLAYAVRGSIVGDTGDAESYLVRALTVYVDELAGVADPTAAQIAATVTIVNQMLSASGTTNDAIKHVPMSLETALGLNATPSIEQPLRQLVDQWKAYHLTDGQALSVTRLADIAGGLSGLIADDCSKTAAPRACTFFSKERTVLGVESGLWPIVRLAGNGDYTDAAQLAIGALFTGLRRNCTAKPEHPAAPAATPQSAAKDIAAEEDGQATFACEVGPFVERFADAIVDYAVQAHAEGAPSDVARSSLRAATEDLVEELGINGGIDRRIASREVLLPDLVLRYDWSASFANAGTKSARVLASLPWLKVRVPFLHTNMAYSALTLSIFDPLAPLAEQATRATGSYAHQGRLWADVLAPRADVEGGIPALSKHLLVGGGVGFRFVAPIVTTAATTTTPAAYEYHSCLHSSGWSDCFQFGVFAKYTM